MQPHLARKAHLNDVHKEIDLLDRKVAHCQNVERFDTDSERASAVQKLMHQRNGLAEIAAEKAASGAEFNPKYLPRSFKS